MRRGQVIVGMVVLFALATAGCGEDEESPAPKPGTTAEATTAETSTRAEPAEGRDEDEERDAALTAVITGEPNAEFACGDAVTDRYVERTYGDRDGCMAAQVPEALARGFKILGTAFGDNRTRYIVTPRGGLYDGVELGITLIDDGERWRVDRLDADIPVGP